MSRATRAPAMGAFVTASRTQPDSVPFMPIQTTARRVGAAAGADLGPTAERVGAVAGLNCDAAGSTWGWCLPRGRTTRPTS
jgi:hypothetical protein